MSFEALEEASDLTDAVGQARSGLKSDVAQLVEALDDGVLFLPLAAAIPGLSDGDKINVDEELTVSPHVLVDGDDRLFVCLFTRDEFLGPVQEAMKWQTDDGELEYCGLPASLAIKIAYDACGNESIAGAVINAMHETELILHQDELGHLTQGKAIPFVAYVEEAQVGGEEEALDPDADLPSELKLALDTCVTELKPVKGYAATRAFDPERDREPHLALRFSVVCTAEQHAELRTEISKRIEGSVPPPGYVDITFDEVD